MKKSKIKMLKEISFKKAIFLATSAALTAAMTLGIHVVVGATPEETPPGTTISPTFTGLTVNGDTEVNGDLQAVDGQIEVVGDLEISGGYLNTDYIGNYDDSEITIDDQLRVLGSVLVAEVFQANGSILANGGIDSDLGTIEVDDNLSITAGNTFSSPSNDLSNVTMDGNIFIENEPFNDPTIDDNLKVNDILEVDGNILADGGIQASDGKIEMESDVEFQGDISADDGTIDFNTTVMFNDGVTFHENFHTMSGKDIDVGGDLYVQYNSQLDGTLEVGYNGVQPEVTLWGPLVIKDKIVTTNIDKVGPGTLKLNETGAQTVEAFGDLKVNDDATIADELTVNDEIKIPNVTDLTSTTGMLLLGDTSGNWLGLDQNELASYGAELLINYDSGYGVQVGSSSYNSTLQLYGDLELYGDFGSYSTSYNDVSAAGTAWTTAQSSCPTGEVRISCGWYIGSSNISVRYDRPSSTGCYVRGYNSSSTSYTLRSYILCFDPSG